MSMFDTPSRALELHMQKAFLPLTLLHSTTVFHIL